jgi:hypothetical protein
MQQYDHAGHAVQTKVLLRLSTTTLQKEPMLQPAISLLENGAQINDRAGHSRWAAAVPSEPHATDKPLVREDKGQPDWLY